MKISNLELNNILYELKDSYLTNRYNGSKCIISINNNTFELTAQLVDNSNNNLGQASSIILPISESIISIEYDSTNKKLLCTSLNGTITEIDISDLFNNNYVIKCNTISEINNLPDNTIFEWQGENDNTITIVDEYTSDTTIKRGYFYQKSSSQSVGQSVVIPAQTEYYDLPSISIGGINQPSGRYYKMSEPEYINYWVYYIKEVSNPNNIRYIFILPVVGGGINIGDKVYDILTNQYLTLVSISYPYYTFDNGETIELLSSGAKLLRFETIYENGESGYLYTSGFATMLNQIVFDDDNNVVDFYGILDIPPKRTSSAITINSNTIKRINTQPFVNPQMQSDWEQTDNSQPNYIKNKPLPFTLEKVTDYTYKCFVSDLDYDFATNYFQNSYDDINVGACSSVKKGNFYGRNYDWIYDNSAEFIIETPNRLGRYATIGIGGFDTLLTQDFVDSKEYSVRYKLVPFKIVDGINEKGLVCNINVVPNEQIYTTATTPEITTKRTLCNMMLPRFVLDNFATAQEAVEYIRDYVSVYNYPTLGELYHYDLHLMVADATKTYIVEFINNSNYIIDVTSKGIMTNFHIRGVTFNTDGSIPTPYLNEGNVTDCGITSHGAGLERYNIINSAYANLSTKTAMQTLMNNLKYTNAYDNVTDANKWLSEFVGNYDTLGNITVDSSLTDLNSVYAEARSLYLSRDRDTGLTWHTVHSAVFDLKNKQITVIFQENDEEYSFSIKSNQIQSDWNQTDNTALDFIKNKPEIQQQIQSDWSQTNSTAIDYIKNKPTIPDTSDKMDKVNPTGTGSFSLNRTTNTTIGSSSVAVGYNCTASGEASHAEGYRTEASGYTSHAEGDVAKASGESSHAEGEDTEASGEASHAEGYRTKASGLHSHAEGEDTEASEYASHAEGEDTTASGEVSHAEGYCTKASSNYQHVQGRYNIVDNQGIYAHIVGNGTSTTPSNAHTLDWNGNGWFAGSAEAPKIISNIIQGFTNTHTSLTGASPTRVVILPYIPYSIVDPTHTNRTYFKNMLDWILDNLTTLNISKGVPLLFVGVANPNSQGLMLGYTYGITSDNRFQYCNFIYYPSESPLPQNFGYSNYTFYWTQSRSASEIRYTTDDIVKNFQGTYSSLLPGGSYCCRQCYDNTYCELDIPYGSWLIIIDLKWNTALGNGIVLSNTPHTNGIPNNSSPSFDAPAHTILKKEMTSEEISFKYVGYYMNTDNESVHAYLYTKYAGNSTTGAWVINVRLHKLN